MTFSIIIATHNVAKFLPLTIQSIINQTYQKYNIIIQDCNSDDGTLDIIDNYKQNLSNLLFYSEKDSGIYDAWNKALIRFQDKLGKWILFLGAGDILSDNFVLYKVEKYLRNTDREIKFAGRNLQRYSINGDFYQLLIIQ